MALSNPQAGSHKKQTTIRLRTTVTGIELDGTITLQDGTVIKKDLVVVADGIRVSKEKLAFGIPG
jgi:2-polyprenyl-6-methoxyphenol hydroxylase-like FAD-dependent oxidoreductase